jgi:hypothetical protein
MEQRKAKRPWLAVVLAIPVVGLGHIYLRRWARAVGWFFAVIGASYFVPNEDIEALNAASGAVLTGAGNIAALPTPDYVALAPVFAVVALSIVDAYLVARNQNAQYRAQQAAAAAGNAETVVECPVCGREVDPELDFCHWCTTKLKRPVDDDTIDV